MLLTPIFGSISDLKKIPRSYTKYENFIMTKSLRIQSYFYVEYIIICVYLG